MADVLTCRRYIFILTNVANVFIYYLVCRYLPEEYFEVESCRDAADPLSELHRAGGWGWGRGHHVVLEDRYIIDILYIVDIPRYLDT